MTAGDFGPWICTGATSTSPIVTSRPEWQARPRAHSPTSESASESQNRFSSSRSSTGSLAMPPSGSVMNAYFACRTAHLLRSRGVIMLVKVNASGPEISICRSTPTSHNVTPSSSAQYSRTGSP